MLGDFPRLKVYVSHGYCQVINQASAPAIVDLETEARENRAKAESKENAIYDIKAVNPNAQDLSDKRTPKELIEFINDKSKEVQSALSRLAEIS